MCLDGLSGPWKGRWEQGRSNTGIETLDLLLERGNLMGQGRDKDGSFTVSGTYAADGGVVLSKIYRPRAPHACGPMTYEGRWAGHHILGTWSDDAAPNTNRGPFLLRPGRGSSLTEAETAEVPISDYIDALIADLVTGPSEPRGKPGPSPEQTNP